MFLHLIVVAIDIVVFVIIISSILIAIASLAAKVALVVVRISRIIIVEKHFIANASQPRGVPIITPPAPRQGVVFAVTGFQFEMQMCQ